MGRRLELVVTAGPLEGRRFVVTEAGLRLGRSSSNDIHIPDEELSRSHCLFEPVGDAGVRLTDLASANGTYLNGTQIAHEPVVLKHGDRIGIGGTRLRVEDPDACDEVFNSEDPLPAPPKRRKTAVASVALIVILLAGAIAYAVARHARHASSRVAEDEPVLRDASYERVDADSRGILRIHVTLTPDDVLSLTAERVPGTAPRIERHLPLEPEAREKLGEILAWRHLKDIDREYAGPEPEPPALRSQTLKVIYGNRQRTIRVTNAEAPEAFRTLCKRLEDFVSAVLGESVDGGESARMPDRKGGAS